MLFLCDQLALGFALQGVEIKETFIQELAVKEGIGV